MAPQMKKLSTTEAGEFFRQNQKSPPPNGTPLHPIVQPFQDRARLWQNGQESWIEAAVRQLSDFRTKIDQHIDREHGLLIDNDQLKHEVEQLRLEITRRPDTSPALEEMKATVSTLTDDVQSLTTENDAWIAHIQEQDAKLESLGQSVEVRDREIVSLGQEIARLSGLLNSSTASAEEPKPEVAASKQNGKLDPEIPVKSRWIDKKYGTQVVVARSTGAGKVVFYKDDRFHTLVRDAFLLQYDPIGG